MKRILSILTLLVVSNFIIAQTTVIPDANFEQALINLGLDTGIPNGTVPTANIDTVTALNVFNRSISDLTGIEYFTALTQLECHLNQLTSLDFTNNNALTSLACSNNQLTNLDISRNTTLTWLDCGTNQLTSLDLSNNNALTLLSINNNQLSSLNVSNNTALIHLFCFTNLITTLDVSNNVALENLRLANNPLNCLNVKNGNNSNMNNFNFDARLNPNLTCIEVDDVTYSDTTWTDIDPQTSFSTNCNNDCNSVGIEENKLSQLSIYPNPTTGSINIDLEEITSNINLRLINALGQVIIAKNYLSTNHIKFDIDAPKGLYFLHLETSDGDAQTLKFIKE